MSSRLVDWPLCQLLDHQTGDPDGTHPRSIRVEFVDGVVQVANKNDKYGSDAVHIALTPEKFLEERKESNGWRYSADFRRCLGPTLVEQIEAAAIAQAEKRRQQEEAELQNRLASPLRKYDKLTLKMTP